MDMMLKCHLKWLKIEKGELIKSSEDAVASLLKEEEKRIIPLIWDGDDLSLSKSEIDRLNKEIKSEMNLIKNI